MATSMDYRKEKKVSSSDSKTGHDHSSELRRLSRIKGQIEGLERMILERRYCPDIVIQIKAARSALKSLESSIVEGHMSNCIKTALKSRDPAVVQEKLDEILSLLKGHG